MLRVVAVLSVLISGSGVAAEPTTVFGLRMGAPLDIPECDKQGYMYQKPAIGSCQGAFQGEESRDSQMAVSRYVVAFAEAQQPAIVVGNLLATTLEGKLTSIEFSTAGPVAAPFVMDALREKFGAESKSEKYRLTNRLGISTEHLSAEWSTKSVRASYVELLPGARVGKVEIDSPAGLEYKRSTVVHPKDQGTKL